MSTLPFKWNNLKTPKDVSLVVQAIFQMITNYLIKITQSFFLNVFIPLRESDPEFHEFAVKTEISDFFISGQEKPFGDLFTKITIKLSKEFLFSRNSAKREMPYLLRSRHEILLRFGVFSERSRRKTAQCTEMIF